jgi:bifunctional enzyme CysN/CysC
MVTGASTAQAAIILIDARKGVLTQTKRHSYLVSLVGIRHVVLAINKMDLVGYNAERFEEIRQEYEGFAAGLGFAEITAIPISALEGDNVLLRSDNTPWYQGPSLMEYLETVPVADAAVNKPFRMRVQWVNRPNLDFRGFCGTIASGMIRPGDPVTVTSSGQTSRVARIVTMDGDLSEAVAGQAVTLTLVDEIDVSRGDLLAAPQARPWHADQFEAKVVWLHEEPLLPGRTYLLKAGATTAPAQVSALNFKVNVNTLQHEPGKTLELNEVGVCTISSSKLIPFDAYRENRATGSFILIDRLTFATVGAGMIDFPLQKSTVGHWPSLDLDKKVRADQKGQKPRVLWFTGLPGAGKSTIANLVEKKLHSLGQHTYLLDGNNLRHGLNRDLDFTDAGQVEHVRRVAEVSKLFVDAGIIVLAAVTSPFRNERHMARELFDEAEFVEIFVNTPLEVCETRQPELYQRARAGELSNVTGIDSTYEPPENPEITVSGAESSAEELAEQIVTELYGSFLVCI